MMQSAESNYVNNEKFPMVSGAQGRSGMKKSIQKITKATDNPMSVGAKYSLAIDSGKIESFTIGP